MIIEGPYWKTVSYTHLDVYKRQAAIGDGIKAAISIDRYLGGTGELASDTEDIEIPPAPEDVDDIVETPRVCESMLCVEKRVGMAEVCLLYTSRRRRVRMR